VFVCAYCQGLRQPQLHKMVLKVKINLAAMLKLDQPSGIFKIIFKRKTKEIKKNIKGDCTIEDSSQTML